MLHFNRSSTEKRKGKKIHKLEVDLFLQGIIKDIESRNAHTLNNR